MRSKADVAVVGAGPCGLFSAITTAKMGAKVVVCEEHKDVGLPRHCAGHISIQGLKRLGIEPPQSAVENRIRGSAFYSPSGYKFRVRFDSPVTYAINRTVFDRHLAQLAEKANVQLRLGSRVQSLLIESGFVRGVSLQNGEKIASKITIDAEGYPSAFVRQIGLPILDKSLVVSAVSCEVDQADDVEEDIVEVYLGQAYAPGLFAWIIPIPSGSAKIGLATKNGNPREYLQRFLKSHPIASSKLKGSTAKNISYHLVPLGGPIQKTYHNGLLIVGDAASQVKPTTGGGIIMGLNCAQIAGKVANEGITKDDTSQKTLRNYQRQWQKALGFDMRAMLQMRLMLNRLSDSKIDRIIRLCSRIELNESIKNIRDLDFQGKALLPLLKRPSVVVVALYAAFESLTSL